MEKYVALLRGINVGGNNKVEMSKLKACFESLGYTNVSTYINSGNVIFATKATDVPTLVTTIEKAIHKAFSLEVRVIVRDVKNIHKICKAIPPEWENDVEQKTDVLFLWDEYDNKKSINLITTTPGVDILLYVPGAILWNVKRSDYRKSGMQKFIGSVVYKHMTARNVNTLRKLGLLLEVL